MKTIWDGNEFRHVKDQEAKKLEAEDKAQILNTGVVDGATLKYRHQFTGYKTRELRAETNPAPVEEKPKKAKATKKKVAKRKTAKKKVSKKSAKKG